MTQAPKRESTDTLLWLGALVVAGVAISWLVMTRPWGSEPTSTEVTPAAALQATMAATASPTGTPAPSAETMPNNPLRMARLALEAGMLIEPDQYSAWSLFGKILTEDPENTAAIDGLEEIAAILADRGHAALEQGRVDDAQALVERIVAVLPRQSDAARLKVEVNEFHARLAEREREAEEAAERAITNVAPVDAPDIASDAVDEAMPVDPLAALAESFSAALSENRLLTPTGDNAKLFVERMREAAEGDVRTAAAEEELLAEFLSRAADATASGDSRAARTWIDEAAELGTDDEAVVEARSALTAHLVEMESMKRLPASSLELTHYEAPEYPSRAALRNVEGWVDLEFIVAVDGTTRDVVISESSHDAYFRREAQQAVERWRFEPREFMGQTIEQRSYTRVRFELL